jgi:autotransporter-associated beta strand protein
MIDNGGTVWIDSSHLFAGRVRHLRAGDSGGAGHVEQTGGTVEVYAVFSVGYRGTGTSSYDLNGGSITQAVASDFPIGKDGATGNMLIHGGTSGSHSQMLCHDSGYLYIGKTGGTGSLTVQDYADVYYGWSMRIGYGQSSGGATSGTLTLEDHAALTSRNGTSYIGFKEGSDGLLEMSDDATAEIDGTLYVGRDGASGSIAKGKIDLSGNATLYTKTCRVGYNAYTQGDISVKGSALLDTRGSDLCIGYGGDHTAICSLAVSTGTETGATGGRVTTDELYIARYAKGTVTLSETGTIEVANLVRFGDGGGIATINLDGGTLACDEFYTQDGADSLGDTTSTLNFNGGTLKATGSNADLIHADANYTSQTLNVKTGGAIIDTNSYNVGINGDLVEDSLSPDGGLRKLGDGTLTLGGTDNSYTGDTLIEAGVLSVTGSITSDVMVDPAAKLMGTGSITGNVAADAGSNVAPGTSIGTLSVTGDVTLGGTLDVEYDSDSEEIDLLTVSGNLNLTGGTLSFSDLGGGTLDLPVYVFATYDTMAGNPAAEVGVPTGYTVDYDYQGNSIALVPEPSALVLLILLGGTMLAGWRVGR